MPRDIVSERRHRHNVKRKAVRVRERLKGSGSGKYRHGPMEPDQLLPPGHRFRPVRDPRGPKKFKWKRDLLPKIREREVS